MLKAKNLVRKLSSSPSKQLEVINEDRTESVADNIKIEVLDTNI